MSAGDKHTFVGQYFETLAHSFLGGELTMDKRGDIFLPSPKISVEVKGSTYQSSYGFRLSVDQIESYEQELSSGSSKRAWYMLFAYRNKSRMDPVLGRRATELSKHTTSSGVGGYLASSVMWCVLLDLSIVSQWKKMMPQQTKSIMGHLGMRTVDISCRDLEMIVFHGLHQHLGNFGLNPDNFNKLVGEWGLRGHDGSPIPDSLLVPITAVVPSSDAKLLRKILVRRGFRMNRETSL